MIKRYNSIIASLLSILIVAGLHFSFSMPVQKEVHISKTELSKIKRNKLPRLARKKARALYEWELTRDPRTNDVPRNARINEIKWKKESQMFKTSSDFFEWIQAGPGRVGGRTRAFSFDKTNNSVVLAAGVSGGIWKSTNRGMSWSLKTPDFQNKNVTSMVQDPRNGFTNIWYAVTGEYDGNSAGSPASGFRGYGIFKSTDNAETWSLLESATNPDVTKFNSIFDYMSRVAVNPTNGDVFVASHAGVLLKSANGGTSWTTVLGEIGSFSYVDVVISSTGRVIASLSADGSDESPAAPNPGIYYSDNNGSNWTDITPSSFPTFNNRSVMALAPSNQDVLYILTLGSGDDHHFFKINPTTKAFEDRSDYLPKFGGKTGDFDTQGGYDMLVTVKPDDENYVIVGGVNLFRSPNGFSTKMFTTPAPTQADRAKYWIGGYANSNESYSQYSNHHPDQHAFVFDPENTNAAFSMHDGGISYTSNIKSSTVSWSDKNSGYFVTQFYHISISQETGNQQVVGGAQDNGSPLFTVGIPSSEDVSSGDGSFSFFGKQHLYTSSQSGTLNHFTIANNAIKFAGAITPDKAKNQLFIHPFEVDKNNENIIYYPAGKTLFRTITAGSSWEDLTAFVSAGSGLTITALETSVTPANILYFGGSDRRSGGSSAPMIYKFVNADTAKSAAIALQLPNATGGSYISDIAVNPENGDEVLVTLSNYNIEGIFHTGNGQDFVQVEGNLKGTASTPGPSIRSAVIAKTLNQTVYLVGTTTGIYATRILDGNNTIWIAQGTDVLGNSIVNSLAYRQSDANIVAGTHGRGAFYGTPNLDVSNEESELNIANSFALQQNYPNPFNPTTSINYTLKSSGKVELSVFDIMGRKVSSLVNRNEIAGEHSITFNANELASGTYIYTLNFVSSSGKSFSHSKKMTLIK